MSRRAKVYWGAVVLASALFLAMAFVGVVGAYRGDSALLHATLILLYAEFAMIIVVFALRGGPMKRHPR
ncbi:hypothetical protein [uncultured Friedmanniella sp.]|uniref:hypothetical protein n=1 Tax=uncultured Friedmanniella sp. TaxID=335381 RepID=UPI0035CB7BF0